MKKKLFYFGSFLLILLAHFPALSQKPNHTFALGDSTFLLDGKSFQMISAEMHYPRIPRECWRARMQAAKAMGINTIGTYVFWNLHEPQKGEYNFAGNNDIAAFVKTAGEEGLWVILRPSPYVCAEWEFGGYPYWLQNEPGLIVRSKEPTYLNLYKNYLSEVGKQLAPLQINHGGNILMVQVENEYGFYSNDKDYLEINRKMFVDAGFDGLLYTCDPAGTVKDGHLNGLLPAINGLDKPDEVKKLVRTYHGGKGPFYIAEWYPAWFDWWGTKHHTVVPETYAKRLDGVLAAGLSINMYMFHGGTTRGYMNGSNFNDKSAFEPQISSYDYDAPLDEAGNATEKFRQFRKVIEKYLPAGKKLPEIPARRGTIVVPSIELAKVTSVFGHLPVPKQNESPLTFEAMHQDYGFVLYRTKLKDAVSGILKVKDLRDYGLIFVNGKRAGILDRRLNQDSLFIELPKGAVTLDILVENLGRINFGPYLLKNKKGITEKVLLNNSELKGWQMYSLPYAAAEQPKAMESVSATDLPVIRSGNFTLQKTGDTYLDMRQWGKGCVWINGHHLGRYWSIGPQQTLYVPAEWLRKGANEVVVLELLKSQQKSLAGLDQPILDSVK